MLRLRGRFMAPWASALRILAPRPTIRGMATAATIFITSTSDRARTFQRDAGPLLRQRCEICCLRLKENSSTIASFHVNNQAYSKKGGQQLSTWCGSMISPLINYSNYSQ